MKKKYALGLVGILVVVSILILTLMHMYFVRSGPQATTPTPLGWPNYLQFNPNGTNVLPAMPSVVPPKVIDLSPNAPQDDKTPVVVQLADGTHVMYLLGPEINVDTFVKNLPAGDKLLVIIPPASLMTNPAAPTISHLP